MAPSATETAPAKIEVDDIQVKKLAISEKPAAPALEQTEEPLPELRTDHREPLKLSGALDKYEHIEVTPVIGREYVNVNLAELLRAPNSDDLIRDLAITGKSSFSLSLYLSIHVEANS